MPTRVRDARGERPAVGQTCFAVTEVDVAGIRIAVLGQSTADVSSSGPHPADDGIGCDTMHSALGPMIFANGCGLTRVTAPM
jgi:hypothetical protein